MVKNTKRAERRHHYARLKHKRQALHYYGSYLEGLDKVRLGVAVDTPCDCSCPMCGNPRRHFGELTMAERRQQASYQDQMSDLENN